MRSVPPRRPFPLLLGTGLLVAALAACGSTGGSAAAEESTPAAGLHADRPLHAAFLVVDGVYNTELIAPMDVFQHTRYHAGKRPPIDVFTVSPDGEPITTFEGLRVVPDYGFTNHPPIDILVVPSAEGSMGKDLENEALIGWVKRVGGQARYVVSLCDGAFVLAQAGLLDGRAATTFPTDYDRFAQRFPKVDLRVNVSFVHDGRFVTSQGGVRSYDAAMYLAELLYGNAAARGIGAGLLIDWRPGIDGKPRFVVVGHPHRRPAS